MKIALFLTPLLTHGGGAEKYFINLAINLAKKGETVDIITMDRGFYIKLSKLLSVFYFRKMLPIEREGEENINVKLGACKWIKVGDFKTLKTILNNYDIIYSKNELLDLGILKYIGYKNLPRIVAGVHTPIYYPYTGSVHGKLHNFLYTGFMYKFLLKGIYKIHVPNSDDLILLENKFGKDNVSKVFYPFSVKMESGVKMDVNMPSIKINFFNIAFVGRLTEQKGVDILYDLIEKLSKTDIFENINFYIAGSGEAEWEEKCKDLSKYKNVFYLGHVANETIDYLYSCIDTVVIPSRYETVNYVALETAKNRKIALVSDIPGPRDVVEDGSTGFLLPLNSQAFVDKIVYLYNLKKNNKEDFDKLGNNAYEFVSERFDPLKISEQMLKLFY